MADNSNPGNFANRPKEDVQAAAQKGGENSTTGGFASMPTDKVVSPRKLMAYLLNEILTIFLQKDIASQGGQASGGSFEKGSEAAKEAGKEGRIIFLAVMAK